MHDGSEGVDSVWISPTQALEEAKAGKRTVIFPTRMNLEQLAESKTVAEAFDAAKARTIVTVEPQVEDREGTMMLTIPAAAGYSVTEITMDSI
ncbi:MAG: NUDIX hydrolase, partial [Pseudomonadota bacterium]